MGPASLRCRPTKCVFQPIMVGRRSQAPLSHLRLDFWRQCPRSGPRGIGVLQRRLAVDDLAVCGLAVEFSRKFDLAAHQAGNRDRGIVDRLPAAVAASTSGQRRLARRRPIPGPSTSPRARAAPGKRRRSTSRVRPGHAAPGRNRRPRCRSRPRGRADRCNGSPSSASASRSVTCERLMRTGSSAAGACVRRIMGPGPRQSEFTISRATAPWHMRLDAHAHAAKDAVLHADAARRQRHGRRPFGGRMLPDDGGTQLRAASRPIERSSPRIRIRRPASGSAPPTRSSRTAGRSARSSGTKSTFSNDTRSAWTASPSRGTTIRARPPCADPLSRL